jgi:hypothetical protein
VKEAKLFRATTFVVIGMLAFSLIWFGGCGGIVIRGGSPITGVVVDAAAKVPLAGALVVLEQADSSGTERVLSSTTTASDGSFRLNTPSPGSFDVVVDASVRSASGATITYAATVTFGVPASASLDQIPLVPEFGSAAPSGIPVTISALVVSSGSIGVPSSVDVEVSALQFAAPAGGSANRVTIPVFAGSTTSLMTMASAFCASGTACASYSLLVPSGSPSVGAFSVSGTQYTLSAQQSAEVNYAVEAKASFHGAALSPDCTPPSRSLDVVIVNGSLPSPVPDLAFTGCL